MKFVASISIFWISQKIKPGDLSSLRMIFMRIRAINKNYFVIISREEWKKLPIQAPIIENENFMPINRLMVGGIFFFSSSIDLKHQTVITDPFSFDLKYYQAYNCFLLTEYCFLQHLLYNKPQAIP